MDNALLVVLAVHLDPDSGPVHAVVLDDAWQCAIEEGLIDEVEMDDEIFTYITSEGREAFAAALGHDEG